MEISGFVKCIARGRCTKAKTPEEAVKSLTDSLLKQVEDFKKVMNEYNCTLERKEALADIRNVAGLLFLALG